MPRTGKSILEPSPEWRHTTRNGLESIAKSANQQLLSAWNNHVVGLKPPINGGLLRLLARSRAYQTQSRRINELVTELDRLSDRLPSSLEELERPALLADRKVRAWSRSYPRTFLRRFAFCFDPSTKKPPLLST